MIRQVETGADRRRGAWRAFAALAGAALLSGCGGPSILDPAGPVAAGNRMILLNSLAVMLVIVVPTMIAILAVAWWFREGNEKAEYRPGFTYSGRIELIVWSIPLLTILFLGGLIWYGSHALDPRRPLEADGSVRPVEIQVVALDWKWLFIYPDAGVASVNALTVPAGTPVRFRLTSASVMNTFFIPQLGSMIYAMNGMETELNLQADREGVYFGQSAHYSGDGFSDMNFDVSAVPAPEFDRWTASLKGEGPVLNVETYAELAEQSHDVAPFTYSHVQEGIFEAVVDEVLAPGGGPDAGEGRGGDEDVHPTPTETGAPAPGGGTDVPAAAPAQAHGGH